MNMQSLKDLDDTVNKKKQTNKQTNKQQQQQQQPQQKLLQLAQQ